MIASSPDNKISAKCLVIGLGEAGHQYVWGKYCRETMTSEGKVSTGNLGSLLLPELSLKGYTLDALATSPSVCPIYTSSRDKDVLFISCAYPVSEERSFQWTQSIFDHVTADKVIILSQSSLNTYHTELLPPTVLMCETSTYKDTCRINKSDVNNIEPPFVLESAPAALLSHVSNS